MRRLLSITLAAAVVALVATAALALPPGAGQGMGPMMQGGAMGGGMGMGNCAGVTGATATQITEEKAKEVAQQYVEKYLQGFAIERILPTTGMRHTMYVVELKSPKGETRTLHVNPWGGVHPFGGPSVVQ